jgi:hypothetical protein
LDPRSREQLVNISRLPFIHHHVAAIPAARGREAISSEARAAPRASIPAPMAPAAQSDLVEVVHSLKQVVCVKG